MIHTDEYALCSVGVSIRSSYSSHRKMREDIRNLNKATETLVYFVNLMYVMRI